MKTCNRRRLFQRPRQQRMVVILCSAAAALCAGAAQAALPGLPALADVQPLDIHDGVNTVPAFAADGAGATIVKVHRENGNAHSTDWLLIAINGKPAAPGVAGVLQQVERDDAPATAPNSASGLFGIQPFDGENEIGALRLARARIAGQPVMLMLQAERRVGDVPSLVDPTRVDLQVWRLDGPVDAVGRAPYRFVQVGRATTTRLYCNATTALHHELGVPYPTGWDNEDTADGCLAPAAQARNAAALEMVRTLDVTSFPNSLGPRHMSAGTTFGAAGYGVVQAFSDGWVQVQPADGSWQFSVFVLENGPNQKRLCIGDQALRGGTYRAWQAVEVRPDGHGQWRATGLPQQVAGCAP